MADMLVIEDLRYGDGPPDHIAWPVARDMDNGSPFLIIRKGPPCLLRWDASQYEARAYPNCKHNLPWLCGVGFGLTRRGALRSLRKDLEREAARGHL